MVGLISLLPFLALSRSSATYCNELAHDLRGRLHRLTEKKGTCNRFRLDCSTLKPQHLFNDLNTNPNLMENGRRSHSHSSIPLVSRLDHLDFIMKYLEGKRSLRKGMEKECMPLDLAMRETYFKGSLMDRVTSLEHRLFQLCLELESSSTSSTSTSTSGCASSSQGSRGQQISRSLPTFSGSNQARNQASHRVLFTRSEIQEESETLLEKKKDPNPKQQVGKKKSSKKEKMSKVGKKVSPKWSHWRILGC